jgi:hypothetical protein
MPAFVDRRQQSLPLPPPEAPRQPAVRAGFALGCYLLVRVGAWLAANIVGGFGVMVLMLLALSGGSIVAAFTHLDNLSSRYLAADPARRLAFDHQLLWIVLLSGFAILLIRLPAFVGRLRREIQEPAK